MRKSCRGTCRWELNTTGLQACCQGHAALNTSSKLAAQGATAQLGLAVPRVSPLLAEALVAGPLQARFAGQVLTTGQELTFEYQVSAESSEGGVLQACKGACRGGSGFRGNWRLLPVALPAIALKRCPPPYMSCMLKP